MINEIEYLNKYDYINNDTLDQYKNEGMENVYQFHQIMFKLTFYQYKHYFKFCKEHYNCRIDSKTGRNKFGTIGGGLSVIYRTNDEWDMFDKFIKCEGCDIEEKLEDIDIELDISDDEIRKSYELYDKSSISLTKIEFYRLNEIYNEYVIDKGEQLEVRFMSTGLGHIVNIKTKDFLYCITDITNW